MATMCGVFFNPYVPIKINSLISPMNFDVLKFNPNDDLM